MVGFIQGLVAVPTSCLGRYGVLCDADVARLLLCMIHGFVASSGWSRLNWNLALGLKGELIPNFSNNTRYILVIAILFGPATVFRLCRMPNSQHFHLDGAAPAGVLKS